MNSIEEMTVDEILDYIGVYLTYNDLKVILGQDEEAIRLAYKELQENIRKSKNKNLLDKRNLGLLGNEMFTDEEILLGHMNLNTFKKILHKYAAKVNKEYLVLLTLYNAQTTIEDVDMTMQEIKSVKEGIARAINLLRKINVTVANLEYEESGDSITRVFAINSRDLIKAIKAKQKMSTLANAERRKTARVEEINKDINFLNIVQVLEIKDIENFICTVPEVSDLIIQQIFYNFVRKYAKNHPEANFEVIKKKKYISDEQNEEFMSSNEFNEAMAEAIIANCKYIDLDKLLLVSCFRYIKNLEMGEKDDLEAKVKLNDETLQLNEAQVIEYIVQLMHKKIQKGTVIPGIIESGTGKADYTVEDLEEDLRRFIQGKYINKEETEQLKQKLLSGEETLKSSKLDEISLVTYNDEEIEQLMKVSDDNIMFCIENNIINKKNIYNIIILLGNCSKNLFVDIVKRELIGKDEIIKLFYLGIIDADHIRAIENDQVRKSLDITDELRILYMTVSNTEKEATPEERERFIRYEELYKVLNIEGKSEEEVKKASIKLICSFEDELDSNILQGLYQYGLITLEEAADWGVDLREMLSNNSIKPTDLKDLYAKRIIDIDAIRNVIVNNNDLPYEEKLDLIYSTFDGETEEEYAIREELIQLLEEKESYRQQGKNTERKIRNQSKPKSKEYITDPHSRWKLISLLDKDYSKKFLPAGKEVRDGHRVFLLPNQNRIVIERMHERKNGRKVSAYANATYVIETEEFFRNMDQIIIDGAINRTALRELSESDRATKIIHSKGWGISIKKYFGIDGENEKYTKQDIEEIDRAIESVNKSRKERI